MAKGKKLTDEEIEASARQALATSLGAPDSDVYWARERNLEFYNAEARGELAPPEIEDRSDFVATDVPDTVDGMLPQLMRIFVGSDDAVTFEGQGQPGSEQEGKLATAYVNHLFYVRNDGVGIVHDWFKDALLQKVGFAKVWAEEESQDAKQKYQGQTPDQLAMLMQEGWMPQGDPEVDDDGLLAFTVAKEDKRVCIKVAACAPAEMRVDVNARWGGEPAMIAQQFSRQRFVLEEEGYDVSDVGTSTRAVPGTAMLEELGETDDFSYSVPDESHEEVDYAEVYIKLDRDGDGIAEWLKICLIGDKLGVYQNGDVAIEQVDDHPFVWICPIPRAHAFFGDCPADRAIQPQKLRTRTIRAIEDNMLLTVNQRTYVNTGADVNIDDVLDNRPGGVVRGTAEPSRALMPIVQPSLGAPAYQFNEYIASWAENRTGFNRYSAGTDQDALNKTKGGMELLTAKADMRMELMARFFAVGMRQLFAKMLKLAIQHQNVSEMIAINGQFVPINPSEFRNQFHVKINVGLGTGSKEQQAARIMGLASILNVGAQAGVVRPQHVAEVIRLYAEANEFKNPERFVDPEPTGMPANPQQFQQMQAQVQEQMGQMQQELQRLAQENEQLKADQTNKQAENLLKAGELELKGRELELKTAQGVAGLDLKRQQASQSERDSHIKNAQAIQTMEKADTDESDVAALSQRVDQLAGVVAELIQYIQPQEAA
ncbi:portal protein [Pseudoxanthomonas beigongshangi]